MSNELFKIVTGQPMVRLAYCKPTQAWPKAHLFCFSLLLFCVQYRVLPNADIEGNAQGRVHFGTKYLLGICGYSLGIGVLLQVMTGKLLPRPLRPLQPCLTPPSNAQLAWRSSRRPAKATCRVLRTR